MKRIVVWTLLALGCAIGAQAAPPASNPALGPPAGAATRSVAKYLELERQLQTALESRRQGALESMIDPDFEFRLPASPDTRSRAQWLRQGFSSMAGASVRDLTVREADDIAVVSFILETHNARYFVVDVWRQSNATLQARYLAAAAAASGARKPNGRE